MTEGNFTPENNLQEKTATKVPEKATGFQPETTEEIIKDITPPVEKRKTLADFLKSRAFKLAPLALLALAGGSRFMGGGSEGSSDGIMSAEAQRAVAEWQLDAGNRIDNYEQDARGNMKIKGELVNRDENAEIVKEGFIEVTDYPAEKYPDGTKTNVIALIPAGTQVERAVERGKLDDKDHKETVATFRCEDVKGEFKDPVVVEKKIELSGGTVCVVPWTSVSAIK